MILPVTATRMKAKSNSRKARAFVAAPDKKHPVAQQHPRYLHPCWVFGCLQGGGQQVSRRDELRLLVRQFHQLHEASSILRRTVTSQMVCVVPASAKITPTYNLHQICLYSLDG